MVMRMKWLMFSMLVGLFAIAPLGGLDANTPTIQNAAIQYGRTRPYSFYYPYNYRYYYPRPEYHRSSQSCYWLYTNGTYVYSCK